LWTASDIVQFFVYYFVSYNEFFSDSHAKIVKAAKCKVQNRLAKCAQQSVHPTLGILARFQAFFYASAFFQSDGVPPPAPARVTQSVRQPKSKTKYIFDSQVSFCR